MFISPSKISEILEKDLGFTPQKSDDNVIVFTEENTNKSKTVVSMQSIKDSATLRIWSEANHESNPIEIQILGHFTKNIHFPNDFDKTLESFTYELFGRIVAIEY